MPTCLQLWDKKGGERVVGTEHSPFKITHSEPLEIDVIQVSRVFPWLTCYKTLLWLWPCKPSSVYGGNSELPVPRHHPHYSALVATDLELPL